MSFVTGTNMELIYASKSVATAKSAFTTEVQINDTTGMGVQARLPVDFWLPSPGQVTKGISITARGIISALNATSPTFTFSIRSGTVGNITASKMLGSAAITMLSNGPTNVVWELQGEFVLSAIGAAGANSTIIGMGLIKSPAFVTTMQGLGSGGWTNVTSNIFDTSITNYINFNVACSANNGSNAITLQSLQIYGLN
jgi:hypothetical protein